MKVLYSKSQFLRLPIHTADVRSTKSCMKGGKFPHFCTSRCSAMTDFHELKATPFFAQTRMDVFRYPLSSQIPSANNAFSMTLARCRGDPLPSLLRNIQPA